MPSDIKILAKDGLPSAPGFSEHPYTKRVIGFFEQLTQLTKFCFRFFKEVIKPPYEFNEFIMQCYKIGYNSYPLVVIMGFIMGLVLTVQSRPTLAQFGAVSWLPGMVAVSIVREMGPVFTALIFAGKVGSSIGAELSSMKVTEQIDSMEVSGINPFKYIVVTRIMATTLMLPILVIIADAVAVFGTYVGVNIQGSVSLHLFLLQIVGGISFMDIFPATIKTFFFGFAVGLIGCYIGYNANKGTEGVGKAANSSVVLGSLAIFILDLIAVQITSLLS